MSEYVDVLYWVLGVVGVIYLGTPWLIKAQQYFLVDPEVEELDFTKLGKSRSKFLLEHTEELFALGFAEPTALRLPNLVPNVTAYLVMLINRATGDKAMVTAIDTTGPVRIRTWYVEFETKFASGETFDTMNNTQLNGFPPLPGMVRTEVPMVRDSRELYRLHRFVIERERPSGQPVVYAEGEAVDYLVNHSVLASLDEVAKLGWLARGKTKYRLTVKGAYLMTWAQMQPMKAIEMAAIRRRARRLIEEFDRAHPDEPIEV